VPEERRKANDKDEVSRTAPSPWKAEPFIGSLGIVAVAVAIGLVLQQSLAVSNIALVFMAAVLVSAISYGRWPSLFTCFISVLAYNFFFLPPLYKFTISDRENVVALFFFALVALVVSNLMVRVRDQVMTARERAKVTEDLYLFSRKLAGIVLLDDLLWATVYQIAAMLKVRVVMLLPDGDGVSVRAGYPPEDLLDEADLAAARWAWDHSRAAGRGSDTLPGAKRLFLPMRTGRGTIGIIGLDNDRPGPILSPDQRRLLDALSDQAALAIERINLVHDIDRAKLTAET
jgi:two-component system sensor histidine kinase KdpD